MAAVSNLTRRVLAAAVFGPLFLALFWAGGLPLLVGLCVVVMMGAREFYRLQQQKGLQPWMRFGIAASLAWCLGVYRFGAGFLLFPLAGLTLSVLTLALCRRDGAFRLADAGATLIGVLYVGFLGSFALLVRNFSGAQMSESGAAKVAVLVLLGIWATDVVAYFAGRLFGRRHPFPQISPGKTGAGFIGGLAAALLAMSAGGRALGLFPFWAGVGLGLVVGGGALSGDLVESMLKRDAGVKESSATIPGHGGVLDRFDSFLFVYPLVYLYLTLLQAV